MTEGPEAGAEDVVEEEEDEEAAEEAEQGGQRDLRNDSELNCSH